MGCGPRLYRLVLGLTKNSWCWAFLPLGVCLPAAAQNLLTNGNFETGDGTGVTNSALTNGRDNSGVIGSYLAWDVRADASTAGTGWTGPTSDHTPGTGQYQYITRGSSVKNRTTIVWQEAVGGASSGHRYTFTGYASIPKTPGSNQSPTFKLTVSATGFTTQTFTFATPSVASWTVFQYGFNYNGTGSTITYALSLITGSSNTSGDNTISWDDFTLTAPEPSTYAAGLAVIACVAWQWRAARRRNAAKTLPAGTRPA